MLDAGDWAAIICSLTALFGVVMSSRNARKAAEKNTTVVSATELEKARLAAETAAYERARKMDVETITRQDKELGELREQAKHLNEDVKRVDADNQDLHRQNERLIAQNRELIAEVRAYRSEVSRLRQRLTRSERGMDPNDETPIVERKDDVLVLDSERIDTDPYMLEVQDYGEQ